MATTNKKTICSTFDNFDVNFLKLVNKIENGHLYERDDTKAGEQHKIVETLKTDLVRLLDD